MSPPTSKFVGAFIMKGLKKTCKFCHKAFNARFPNQKFCSQKCFGKSKITRITRKCLNCERKIMISPSRIESGRGKYCSKNCYSQAIRNGKLNKGYFKKGHKGYRNSGNFKKGHIPWNKNKKGYSLPKGRKVSQKTRIKMRNAKLGKKISEKHKKNISEGVKNHLPRTAYKIQHPYQTDVKIIARKIRGSQSYRDWRNKIIQRDSTCQSCNDKKKLIAHHFVDFFSIINEIRYAYSDRKITYKRALKYKFLWDLDNGITLCKNCHTHLHQNSPSVPLISNS